MIFGVYAEHANRVQCSNKCKQWKTNIGVESGSRCLQFMLHNVPNDFVQTTTRMFIHHPRLLFTRGRNQTLGHQHPSWGALLCLCPTRPSATSFTKQSVTSPFLARRTPATSSAVMRVSPALLRVVTYSRTACRRASGFQIADDDDLLRAGLLLPSKVRLLRHEDGHALLTRELVSPLTLAKDFHSSSSIRLEAPSKACQERSHPSKCHRPATQRPRTSRCRQDASSRPPR